MSKPMFSVITPTHRQARLQETVDSVLEQTFQDWDMHIVGNAEVKDLSQYKIDPRIHLSFYNGPLTIGAIKNNAFHKGEGKYLVEL